MFRGWFLQLAGQVFGFVGAEEGGCQPGEHVLNAQERGRVLQFLVRGDSVTAAAVRVPAGEGGGSGGGGGVGGHAAQSGRQPRPHQQLLQPGVVLVDEELEGVREADRPFLSIPLLHLLYDLDRPGTKNRGKVSFVQQR